MIALRYRIAQSLSVLGHPFVLLPLTIALSFAGSLPPGRLLVVVGVFLASTILPFVLVIRRKVRAQEWTDADVSNQTERQHFYYVTLVVLALSLPIAWLLRMPTPLITGLGISLVLLSAGLLINRRSKISLHMMFAAYCVVILGRAQLAFVLCSVAFVLALAWARLVLKRHTLTEIIFGLLLGATGGVCLQYIYR